MGTAGARHHSRTHLPPGKYSTRVPIIGNQRPTRWIGFDRLDGAESGSSGFAAMLNVSAARRWFVFGFDWILEVSFVSVIQWRVLVGVEDQPSTVSAVAIVCDCL